MKRFVAAALLGLAATAANADEITLREPLAGATLHEGGVDMTVYWTEAGSGAEVVAVYLPRSGASEPSRLVLRLEDGDTVSFGLPGERQVKYAFSRTGDAVQVVATRPWRQLASR